MQFDFQEWKGPLTPAKGNGQSPLGIESKVQGPPAQRKCQLEKEINNPYPLWGDQRIHSFFGYEGGKSCPSVTN
ncbi:hypothetical protein TNCV_955631 [Trichonephila clavipes]|nr:hypothetical protein TNCV_955631 [Trichonephila clavipes]